MPNSSRSAETHSATPTARTDRACRQVRLDVVLLTRGFRMGACDFRGKTRGRGSGKRLMKRQGWATLGQDDVNRFPPS